MRTRRILVVALTVLATGLLAVPAAHAGAWEETLLDPPPARVERGVTYTFGYWILQHGSYPYRGDLGPTALRASDGEGAVVDFPGVAAATEGHYSAEVVFPHDGTWTISSQHEVLMTDALVATVTVPGRVAVAPSAMKERAPHAWGPVRPSFPPSAPDAEMDAPATPPDDGVTEPLIDPRDVAPRGHETAVTDPPGAAVPAWLPAAGGAVTVGLALWLTRRYRRVNR
jgi:hypothetical protein